MQSTIRSMGDSLQIIIESKRIRFDPAVYILAITIFSISLSFSKNPTILISVIIFCLVAPVLTQNIHASRYYKLFLLFSFIVAVIALPKIINSCTTYRSAGLSPQILFPLNSEISMFMLRAIASTGFLILATSYSGLWNIIVGLRELRVPEKISLVLLFFGLFLVRLLRRIPQRLLARYSRILVSGVKKEWIILSSIVSDMFINSVSDSKRFYLGLCSRNFSFSVPPRSIRIWDILLLVLSIIVALFSFLVI